jgi:DNA-binding NarL/FixJ family response regulator
MHEAAAVSIPRDTQAPFVGRAGELSALANLRLQSHRYGRFAMLAGEPGIGKSRIVAEFIAAVPRGRVAIGIGRALENVRSPHLPWLSALQTVAPGAVQAIHPEAGFKDKASMYASAVDALRQSVERRAAILVLEDLHWADAGSLDLLEVLLANLAAMRRLLIIGTVRTSQAHETMRRISTNAAATVLELLPLAPRECAALVRSMLPDAAPASRVQRIARLSGGNPFFAWELAKNAASAAIPLTLTSAIDSRIAPFDRAELEALEAAAVLGEEFSLQLLADVLQHSIAQAAQRLQRAQRDGIVVEQDGAQFRFGHALIRAVLLSRLTAAQRIGLHRRAASSLEQNGHFDALGFARLAYHHAGAHDREKAYAYNMRAGGLAYSVHAYADAAEFYAGAAQSAEPGSIQCARALARQGDALLRTSALDDAEHAYTAAIAIYRAAGVVDDAARLYQSLARSLYNQDRVRDALTAIERAVAELPGLPAALRDDLRLQGAMLGAEVSAAAGMRWLESVNEQNVRETHSGGAYYAIAGSIYATQGDAQAWRRAKDALEKNVAAVQPDAQYVGHFGNMAANALFLGFPATALYEQCFALARAFNMDVYEAAFASHAAFERWLRGDDESFSRLAVFAAGHDAPIPALHAYVLLNGILRDEAVPAVAEIEAIIAGGHNEFFGPLTGTFARRMIRAGEKRAARRVLEAAAERLSHAYAAWETLTAMAEYGSSALRDRALALTAPYEESHAPAFAATAAAVRALCAHREGDERERERYSARAGSLYAEMGWVHHQRQSAQGVAPRAPQRETLSEREVQIAQLLQRGCTNRAMAAQLFVSEKTIEKHLAKLYEKLSVSNRTAAVRALARIAPQE